ncbi:hypothetical protein KCU88_g458, partial [Aureobasidium melanogenum]
LQPTRLLHVLSQTWCWLAAMLHIYICGEIIVIAFHMIPPQSSCCQCSEDGSRSTAGASKSCMQIYSDMNLRSTITQQSLAFCRCEVYRVHKGVLQSRGNLATEHLSWRGRLYVTGLTFVDNPGDAMPRCGVDSARLARRPNGGTILAITERMATSCYAHRLPSHRVLYCGADTVARQKSPRMCYKAKDSLVDPQEITFSRASAYFKQTHPWQAYVRYTPCFVALKWYSKSLSLQSVNRGCNEIASKPFMARMTMGARETMGIAGPSNDHVDRTSVQIAHRRVMQPVRVEGTRSRHRFSTSAEDLDGDNGEAHETIEGPPAPHSSLQCPMRCNEILLLLATLGGVGKNNIEDASQLIIIPRMGYCTGRICKTGVFHRVRPERKETIHRPQVGTAVTTFERRKEGINERKNGEGWKLLVEQHGEIFAPQIWVSKTC